MPEYLVRIKGEEREDDGLVLVVGLLGPGQTWYEVPLPPCPDCGGDLIWYEAGYAPGTRKCMGTPVDQETDGRPVYDVDGGCGSLFHVESRDRRITVTREKFYPR